MDLSENPLNPTEQKIMALVADGMISDRIAERLGLSSHSVKNHRRRACEKLGADNTAHAMYILLKSGWL